ncbi:hypothetical protein [Nocardiopsis kunsanensis]|uniref:Uncharacterized protein n=1 Tax=Nocardiopsis kunsanensis TaxID=141693 RepID=A0A918XDC7_9ACTN|nr:hypothetical protein [Nocardiopsis kunsanensis]GHD26779.1 hypothetical protein GCM10007147_25170 [Nocardiopsis kunsanensis]
MLQTFPVQDLSRISARLHDEYSALPHRRVERCVSDAWKCAEHLGIAVTPHLVERVAREHLEAMVTPSQPDRDAPSADTLLTGPHTVPGPH